MEKLEFKDSRAIKITSDMRKALDTYNQKKYELEKANDELKTLENSRKQKEDEINALNINTLDGDKKNAKETNKKIKTIDKEITKIQNDIQKINDKINKFLEQNKQITIPDVNLKSFKDFGKTEDEQPVINIDDQIINNIDIVPEIKNENNEYETNITSPDVNEETQNIEETPIVKNENIDDNITEIDEKDFINSIEPVVLENPEINNVEIVDDKEEIKEPETISDQEEEIFNPFLSEDSVNKIWEEMDVKTDGIEESAENNLDNEKLEEDTITEEEPVENNFDIELKENPIEDNSNLELEEDSIKELDEETPEKIIKLTNAENPEIEKPNIFGKNSEFIKIANKDVSPKPLIPEGGDTSLVCYEDYNDYKFKFGQKHYGKEALTPKELSDLATLNEFLDREAFEIQRSSQYVDIKKENDELKERITDLNKDYKQQISDLKHEHNSNLDELEKLIDKANNIINHNKERIADLENTERNLNKTIDKQTSEIESLNKKQQELEETIDKLNKNIMNLEETRDKHETKIQNYETKFKEVLGIVREVKMDS